MKFSTSAAFLLAVSTASTAFGFSPSPSTSFVKQINRIDSSSYRNTSFQTTYQPTAMSKRSASAISMSFSVGVVGATGAVGKEIIDCLDKSSLDVSKLRIFGSSRSAGSKKDAGKFGEIDVELFDVAAARECDIVFLAVSGDFSLEHAKALSEGDDGAVVIDNSSAFRYDADIPLVVPEINGETCKGAKLIANPNCTTAIGLMALWPLHKLFKLKRVIMSVSLSKITREKILIFSLDLSGCIRITLTQLIFVIHGRVFIDLLCHQIWLDLPSIVWCRTARNG